MVFSKKQWRKFAVVFTFLCIIPSPIFGIPGWGKFKNVFSRKKTEEESPDERNAREDVERHQKELTRRREELNRCREVTELLGTWYTYEKVLHGVKEYADATDHALTEAFFAKEGITTFNKDVVKRYITATFNNPLNINNNTLVKNSGLVDAINNEMGTLSGKKEEIANCIATLTLEEVKNFFSSQIAEKREGIKKNYLRDEIMTVLNVSMTLGKEKEKKENGIVLFPTTSKVATSSVITPSIVTSSTQVQGMKVQGTKVQGTQVQGAEEAHALEEKVKLEKPITTFSQEIPVKKVTTAGEGEMVTDAERAITDATLLDTFSKIRGIKERIISLITEKKEKLHFSSELLRNVLEDTLFYSSYQEEFLDALLLLGISFHYILDQKYEVIAEATEEKDDLSYVGMAYDYFSSCITMKKHSNAEDTKKHNIKKDLFYRILMVPHLQRFLKKESEKNKLVKIFCPISKNIIASSPLVLYTMIKETIEKAPQIFSLSAMEGKNNKALQQVKFLEKTLHTFSALYHLLDFFFDEEAEKKANSGFSLGFFYLLREGNALRKESESTKKQKKQSEYEYTPYEHTPYEHTSYGNTPYENTPYEYTPYEHTSYKYTESTKGERGKKGEGKGTLDGKSIYQLYEGTMGNIENEGVVDMNDGGTDFIEFYNMIALLAINKLIAITKNIKEDAHNSFSLHMSEWYTKGTRWELLFKKPKGFFSSIFSRIYSYMNAMWYRGGGKFVDCAVLIKKIRKFDDIEKRASIFPSRMWFVQEIKSFYEDNEYAQCYTTVKYATEITITRAIKVAYQVMADAYAIDEGKKNQIIALIGILERIFLYESPTPLFYEKSLVGAFLADKGKLFTKIAETTTGKKILTKVRGFKEKAVGIKDAVLGVLVNKKRSKEDEESHEEKIAEALIENKVPLIGKKGAHLFAKAIPFIKKIISPESAARMVGNAVEEGKKRNKKTLEENQKLKKENEQLRLNQSISNQLISNQATSKKAPSKEQSSSGEKKEENKKRFFFF